LFISCISETEADQNLENSNEKKALDTVVFGEEVARMEEGTLKILNPNQLKAEFKLISKSQGYNPEYSNQFKLVEGDKSITAFNSYLLILTSVDQTLKTAIEVAEKDGVFYKIGDSTTVNCLGCWRGCDPKKVNGKYICTDCEIANSNCTKSVSVVIEDPIP